MKGLFIINPSSGRQNFIDKIKEIAGMLVIDQICNTIDVFYTEKQDDALNKAAALEKGQYDFVVAVGGDGTLNEVINGVVLSQSNTPVAVISAGTVNDFATYLNLPQTPKEFCDMIADFKLKKVDVGKVNEKYFINVVAAGLLSDTGFKVSKDKKAVMGKLAYYLEKVNLQAEPVLLTYTANPKVELLMNHEEKNVPILNHLDDNGTRHKVWKIDNRLKMKQFKK